MLSAWRNFGLKRHIHGIDLGRLNLLHGPRSQPRRDVAAQKFCIALKRSLLHRFAPPARRPDRNPVVDPLAKRGLVRCHMCAVVSGLEKLAQLRSRLSLSPVKGGGEPTTIDPVTQPPRIFATLIEAAVAVAA